MGCAVSDTQVSSRLAISRFFDKIVLFALPYVYSTINSMTGSAPNFNSSTRYRRIQPWSALSLQLPL